MANAEKVHVYPLSDADDLYLTELGWRAADAEELWKRTGKPGDKDRVENLQAFYSKERLRLLGKKTIK